MNLLSQPGTLQTPGFAHYAVAWSPFHTSRLAVASAANFGLVGNGRLHLVSSNPAPGGPPRLGIDKQYETQDGLYDVAWSEIHENQLVTASGDGSIRLWDVMLNDLPIRVWQEHTREVFSVDWSNVKKDTFASSSWDGTVKLWTPDRPRSVTTLQAHHSCVYQAMFSPHQVDLLATCSTDGTVKIFDLRTPAYVNAGPGVNTFTTPLSAAVLTIPASATEILSIDWNKYRPMVLASAGVDKNVKIWDCRMIKPGETPQVGGNCETQLLGHEYAVRKVQWSPHRPDILATASYDMTCRIWTTTPTQGRPQLLHIHDTHTEFVVGASWSLYEEGVLASYFLSDSLHTLYDYQPITLTIAGGSFIYTTHHTCTHDELDPISGCKNATVISLRTPDTAAANWALQASSIWASSIYLADHIGELHLDAYLTAASRSGSPCRILELGASAGLPSILIAKMCPTAAVTATDYPDAALMQALSENVTRNNVAQTCGVVPFAWGTDPEPVLRGAAKFDVVLAADTLWNSDLHEIFIDALQTTLKKSVAARIHLVVGLHTGRYTIGSFLRRAMESGFDLESVVELELKGSTRRDWDVNRENEDDQERRRWIIWIQLKWTTTELSL
ncbi:hypothetical protein HYPSUDRAFT_83122 [Hypholoma sublateritium FD-334 SS-4]|uniref:Peroxin-7 n=1 Tax=Hypholoma sublateritium (strain FD-334 SS-4) TaxID=945553 RepID=A0A0D2MVN1_HYPSF|nr:hypothetical protein HYPSUDRAFT_83122 [Hypholoma sublateritium FD-334 SS-4]